MRRMLIGAAGLLLAACNQAESDTAATNESASANTSTHPSIAIERFTG